MKKWKRIGSIILYVIGLSLPSAADTFTVSNTKDSDSGSLRWAIAQANGKTGADTVLFVIPTSDPGFNGSVWRINPKSPLPSMTDNRTAILGSSQTSGIGDKNPDGPEILLDGTQCPDPVSGISIQSSQNLISGLVFSGWGSAGVEISGNQASRNRISGNYFGTTPAGTDTASNGYGISLLWGAGKNQVGGSELQQRNIISGNRLHGIYVFQSDSNAVAGNLIGLDRTGTKILGNGMCGVLIAQSKANRTGGKLPGETNIISGNGQHGIDIEIGKATRKNAVQGNYIGTDVNGKAALGNGGNGITLGNGASVNLIGGVQTGESNLISGNKGCGIYIFTLLTDSNQVVGNLIGTDADVSAPLPNQDAGICIFNGPKSNLIGPSNIIRHQIDGVRIEQDPTLYNCITLNSICNNTRYGIVLFGGNGKITSPSLSWNGIKATGSTVPNSLVEIFSDSSGQGRNFEGTAIADGNGIFSWTGTPIGPNITSTVTDPFGNTSEFSKPVQITGVKTKDGLIPQSFFLSQNYPNPFNPSTIIAYEVREKCQVVLSVVDALGREVETLMNGERQPGRYEAVFSARNLPSGVYFAKIRMKDFTAVKKLVLME